MTKATVQDQLPDAVRKIFKPSLWYSRLNEKPMQECINNRIKFAAEYALRRYLDRGYTTQYGEHEDHPEAYRTKHGTDILLYSNYERHLNAEKAAADKEILWFKKIYPLYHSGATTYLVEVPQGKLSHFIDLSRFIIQQKGLYQ